MSGQADLAAPALTATASGTNTIELGWNAVAGAASYELQLWNGSAWDPLVSGLTGTTYTHGNLAAPRTYYYRVRAVDANGAGGVWSQWVQAVVTSAITGATPTATPTVARQADLAAPALTATPSGTNTIELGWNAVAGAASYELQLWNGSAWDPLVSGLTGTTYTHGNLAAPRTYYYRVRALDANGAGGAWSQWVQAVTSAMTGATSTATATPTVTATPTPTSIPVGPGPEPTATPTATATAAPQADLAAPALTATASGTNTVELGWNAVAGAAGYELQLWNGSAWDPLVSGLTGTTYTHGNLAAGWTYFYQVRALDANGAGGAWSQWVQATTPMGLAAPALTATPSGADTVELGWNAVANAAGYELQLWTGSAWIPLVSGLTGTTYTHRNLAAGRTYYYRIRALDANGEGGVWSQWVQAAVPASATRRESETPVAL